MKRFAMLILFFVLLLQLEGCSFSADVPTMERPFPGLAELQDDIPRVEEVATYPVEEKRYFPAVESAYLYRNGEKEVLENDDPRLRNLLKLLEISEQNRTTTMQFSLIREDEIQQCYNANKLMVEVVFAEMTDEGYNSDAIGLLVCGNSYLRFLNPEEGYSWIPMGERLAERKWAYESILLNAIEAGIVEERYRYLKWDDEAWFDIVTYCGF